MTTRAESIRNLGLEGFALDLEADGLAIVPPEVHGVPLERFDAMADWLIERSAELVGCPFSLETGPAVELEFSPAHRGLGDGGGPPNQFLIYQLAHQSRLFRDLAVNPVAVALMRYMIGARDTRFSSHNAFIKWSGEYGYGPGLGIHCDQQAVPLPWGRTALTANANWVLTDYTKTSGPLAYVPGSHRLQSRPTQPAATQRAVPVLAPKGSLIIFHGATWHGAFPRTDPGMRLMVANYYRHMMVLPQEDIRNSFPRDLAADCEDPDEFARLAGFADQWPYLQQIEPLPRRVGSAVRETAMTD